MALGHTVFVLAEFQIVDEETARTNEQGENARPLQDAVRALGGDAFSRADCWTRRPKPLIQPGIQRRDENIRIASKAVFGPHVGS